MSVEAVYLPSAIDPSQCEAFEVRPGRTVRQALEDNGLWSKLFEAAIVVGLNGEQLYEREYDRILRPGDRLELRRMVQGPAFLALPLIWQAAVVVVVAVAAKALLVPKEPGLPSSTDQKEGSPTYSLSAGGNRYRPGSRGGILYGTMRIVPDFDQPAFSVFDAENEQTLHLIFRVTQREADVDINSIRFKDEPLTNFDNWESEVLAPGQVPTLFPEGVITSDAVDNLELTDNYTNAYVVCGVGEKVNHVAFDLGSPAIVKQDKKTGKFKQYRVEMAAEVREIDDAGNPLGVWTEVGRPAFVSDNRDALRRSHLYAVSNGRYEARMKRVTFKDDNQFINDTVNWLSLRGYKVNEGDVSDCTRVALKLRSSEKVGNRSLTSCSMVASRKLPLWDATNGWSSPQLTNHFAWALADLCRADYAGKRGDAYYDLAKLKYFADRSDLASAHFNAYFDTEGVSVWDALEKAGMPGRVDTVDYAGRYHFVRDEQQSDSVMHFNMRNIVKNSFGISMAGPLAETADSVIVKFKDEAADYRDYNDGDGLLCKVPESDGLNPREVTLFGVTNRHEAAKLGTFYAAASAYRRRLPKWGSGRESRIPFYGAQVELSHFLFGVEGKAQTSGNVMAFDGTDVLTLTEAIPSTYGDPRIILQEKNGKPTAAYQFTRLSDRTLRVLPIASVYPDWTQLSIDEPGYENTRYAIGDGIDFFEKVKVTKVQKSGDRFELRGHVDDQRVYLLSDGVVAPPAYVPPGVESLLPVVDNLTVTYSGTTAEPVVAINWRGENCDRYYVELSGDGVNWYPYASGYVISAALELRPEPGTFHFRVRGENILRGTAKTVVINTANVATAIPPDPTGLQLRETFTGPTLKVEWTSEAYRHLISVLVGGVEEYAEVYDGTEWDFAAALAQEYGIGRSFEVRVYAVGENEQVSTGYASLAVNNPAPAILNNLSVVAVGSSAVIRFDQPVDTDFSGVSVWVGDASPVSIGAGTLAIDKSANPVLSVEVGRGVQKHIVVAAVDEWGDGGLNYSGEHAITGGLIQETEIGPGSIKSPHVAANQITATHTFIQELSAISADMGEVVAGLFKTSAVATDARVEIDSAGDIPFWIGRLTKDLTNAHVAYDAANKIFMVQDPATGLRLEIEPDGSMPFWLGSGAKNADNALLYVEASTGTLNLRGLRVLDDAGGVFMASGTGMDFSRITGVTRPDDYAKALTSDNLFVNGDAEYGNSYLWDEHFDYESGSPYGVGHFSYTSNDSPSLYCGPLTRVEASEKHEFFLDAYSENAANGFLGLSCYDQEGVLIRNMHVHPKAGTDTTLAQSLSNGATEIYLNKVGGAIPGEWQGAHLVYHSYLVTGTQDDYSDLPNRNVHALGSNPTAPTVVDVDASTFKVVCAAGKSISLGSTLPAGTKVRHHISGSSAMYPLLSNTAWPSSWQRLAGVIDGEQDVNAGDLAPGANKFWTGAKYVKVFFRPSIGHTGSNTTHLDNITLRRQVRGATWGVDVDGQPTDLAGINGDEGSKLAGIEENANRVTNTNELTDGANLGGTADWSGVGGAGKPDDNANRTTNTNQLMDGANLGGTADWSGVGGSGKPDDNADVTASNPQSPGWLSSSVPWSGNKINSSNKGTYMSGAFIGTAEIEFLAVETAQLNDGSVTASYYADASNKVSLAEHSQTVVQTISVPDASAAAGGIVEIVADLGLGEDSFKHYWRVDVELRRNGTTIWEKAGTVGDFLDSSVSWGVDDGERLAIYEWDDADDVWETTGYRPLESVVGGNIKYVDYSPDSGVNVYDIWVWVRSMSGTPSVWVKKRSIWVRYTRK